MGSILDNEFEGEWEFFGLPLLRHGEVFRLGILYRLGGGGGGGSFSSGFPDGEELVSLQSTVSRKQNNVYMRGGVQYQESSDPGQQSWAQNPGGLQINQCCSLNTVKGVLLSFSYLLNNNYILSVEFLLCDS